MGSRLVPDPLDVSLLLRLRYMCVCVQRVQNGALNRARPKADFPTFVSVPDGTMFRTLETANFKLISLGKGRTRINFFLNHVSISPRLSNVFKSAESSFRNRKQTKRKKKSIHAPTRHIPITFTPVHNTRIIPSVRPPFHSPSFLPLSPFPSPSMASSRP